MGEPTTSIALDEQMAYWSHEFKGPLTELQMLTLDPRDLAMRRALLASLERLKVLEKLHAFADDGEFIELHAMDEAPYMQPYMTAVGELTARRAYSKSSCAALIAEAYVRGLHDARNTNTGEGE